MKALSNMSRLMVSPELLFLLLKVYEAKGKEFYYDELFDRDKDVFLKKTIEQNTYYFGKIIGLDLTDARIRLLSRKKLTPKNKKEVLLNNIKGALKAIQKNPKDFEVYPNEFDNLARILSKNYEPIKFGVFEKEQADTILGASKKANKKEVLEQIITEYNRQNKTKLYELTQLIANFYIDFVNAELF